MSRMALAATMRRTRTVWLLALLMLAGASTGTHAQDGDDEVHHAGQGTVLITLFTDSSAHGDPPQLHYTLILNTTVEGNQTHRETQVPLPHGARLHDLRLHPEDSAEAPTTRTHLDADGAWALAEWDDAGPLPGSQLTMRMEARQDVDPDEEIPVAWDRMPVSLTRVWIALPPSHTPKLDPEQAVRREAPLGGLDLWNLSAPKDDRLAFMIEPVGTLDDLSLAFPPPAWSAWAVLIGLALLSGGAWFLGKKAESRKDRRKGPSAP